MLLHKVLGVLYGSFLALILAAITWMSTAPGVAFAGGPLRLYVKWDAGGANNGTSWTDAYTSLQSALDVATGSGYYEIWVAAGTYRPFRTLPPSASDTFQLHNNTGVYGGFAGTETMRSQRNWQANVTILSGYWFILGSPHYAYHVVTGSGTDATAVLDGFTVTGGNANGAVLASEEQKGGGMLNVAGNPTVRNVIFSGNYATYSGGGMFNQMSSPVLTNVTFTENATNGWGGGLYHTDGDLTMNDVSFTNNSATTFGGGANIYSSVLTLTDVAFTRNSSGQGGGMYSSGNIGTLTNITFRGNHAPYGGGLYDYTGTLTVTNAIFSGNWASYDGGAILNNNSAMRVLNTTLSGNSATSHGGAIANVSGGPIIGNSILWGNTAPVGAQLYYDPSSTPTVAYTDIQGGWSGMGTGNINSDPKFVRNPSPGADGIWGTGGDDDYGDLHLKIDSPAIDKGVNAGVPVEVTTDRDGNPRILGSRVDMGAYETFVVRTSLPLVER